MSHIERGIERRWNESEDQVAATAAAVASADLHLANGIDEIATRRARLKGQGLDLEAIVGEDDSLWLSFLGQGLAAAKAVGRVVRPARGQPPVPIGTGVLVSARLLLTNNHVIPDRETAAGMAVELGYEYGDDGTERASQLYPLDPADAFFTDEERDFTIVAVSDVDGVAAGARYGVVALIPQLGKALKAEHLNVIHHPSGDRKRISIRANTLVAEDDTWLRYTSDTRPGSSGAPVFNDQWEMVALHHGAVPRQDGTGRSLTRAGQVDGDAPASVEYSANEGVRVSQIVGRLTQTTDPAPAAVVQQILATGAGS